MQHSAIVIGLGEMGGVFARACLRTGYTVVPVTRDSDMTQVQQRWPEPSLVIVAVNESGFEQVMPRLSASWRDRALLIQNELLPSHWQVYGEDFQPSVISVWFEKKPGQDVKVIIPSPVFGPQAETVAQCLASLNIPTQVLSNSEQLLYQLVLKNVYILTSNIAGLKYGGSVGELRKNHADFTRQLTNEVIDIQSRLSGAHFDPIRLLDDMLLAFDGDPDHKCMGRSAPARLQSALQHAEHFGLELPTLREISANIGLAS